MIEADVLDTAGLTGAEVREEIRAAAVTARRMMVAVRSMINASVSVSVLGPLLIIRLAPAMCWEELRRRTDRMNLGS
jgi:hypothetical protein